MPLYGTKPPIEAEVGGIYTPFSGDTVTAGSSSIPVHCNFNVPGGASYIKTAYANFASTPTAAVVNLQSSDDDVDAHYVNTGSGAVFSGTQASLLVAVDEGNSAYYRIQVLSGSGLTAITVKFKLG